MFSVQNAKQADMCRFCWMCRHICPVAGATGSEGWGPRARGLMVSMIERGTEYDAEIADSIYHCTLCDACANDCVTGWKPADFIREARTLAVVNDIAPQSIMTQIENLSYYGNVYGLPLCEKLGEKIDALPKKADLLLYLGQSGRTVGSSVALNLMEILDKAGIVYTVLKDELPSGTFLNDLMGTTGDVQAAAAAVVSQIVNSGAKEIVALSPSDTVMFREYYGGWGLLENIKVSSATSFVAGLLAEKKLKVLPVELTASLQEPVKLTRGLEEENPLLEIVAALGINYIPLFLHGKFSRCVGNPIMECYDSSVAKRMVAVRCDDARRINSNVIITASPDDYYIMNKYADKDIRIVDIYDLINTNS
ncbi:MAG: (Fe-S)-binding protein [Oscillospiraceae bacterium]|nr:(Fe-S)-binding protein [Oscillospiraceae bacterium]